ncbi:MAG: hypothetical protein ACP5G5_05795 [Thermoplasmata archaeon]|jgi:hypothetical protein|nr:hypothetical protein [Thermoplasmatales archaeon]
MEDTWIPIYYLEKRGVKGYESIGNFIESVHQKEIYLIDTNSFRGRDINLKVLSRIAPIYDVWFESNIRWRDDVIDILLAGSKIAVLGGRRVNENFLISIMENTDNIALKSNDEGLIKKFISIGGKIVITDLDIDAPERYVQKEGRLLKI